MSYYQRKLSKIGRSGIAVFLPIAWIRGMKLVPGDLVELTEQGGIIKIKSIKKASNRGGLKNP